MAHPNMRSVTLRALKDPAIAEESAAWFAMARSTLVLSGWEMAEAVGVSERTWWAWESGDAAAPHRAAIVVRRLLNDAQLTSTGKIKCA